MKQGVILFDLPFFCTRPSPVRVVAYRPTPHYKINLHLVPSKLKSLTSKLIILLTRPNPVQLSFVTLHLCGLLDFNSNELIYLYDNLLFWIIRPRFRKILCNWSVWLFNLGFDPWIENRGTILILRYHGR